VIDQKETRRPQPHGMADIAKGLAQVLHMDDRRHHGTGAFEQSMKGASIHDPLLRAKD
jgi:hypothetical protein